MRHLAGVLDELEEIGAIDQTAQSSCCPISGRPSLSITA